MHSSASISIEPAEGPSANSVFFSYAALSRVGLDSADGGLAVSRSGLTTVTSIASWDVPNPDVMTISMAFGWSAPASGKGC